ncbi:MAG: hypothetical protein HYT97_00575 [Elusimicrobia bacterium]|nr:hypothetical protein [Elusimicrobiota bacterium]
MLKIICLIRPEPNLIYFVNKINKQHKVSLVIVESRSIKYKLLKKIKKHGFVGTCEIILNKINFRMKCKEHEDNYKNFFDTRWKTIDKDIPALNTTDVNDQVIYERLLKERPDIILVHGTSLVEDRIIERAKTALNLHWGLAPYYRGSQCTEWALINYDPYNIGVTIHQLDKRIDGGAIFAQERILPKPNDTVHSLNIQLTKLGTELILRAIDKLKSGEKLHFVNQDLSSGFLYLNRHWNRYLYRYIKNMEKENMISLMLEHPSKKQKLPIVKLT